MPQPPVRTVNRLQPSHRPGVSQHHEEKKPLNDLSVTPDTSSRNDKHRVLSLRSLALTQASSATEIVRAVHISFSWTRFMTLLFLPKIEIESRTFSPNGLMMTIYSLKSPVSHNRGSDNGIFGWL